MQGKYDVIDSRQGRSGGFTGVPDPDQSEPRRQRGGGDDGAEGEAGGGGRRGNGSRRGRVFDIEAEHRRLSVKIDQELDKYEIKPVPRSPRAEGEDDG